MASADLLPILFGGLLLSILHALIPNHWLPLLAIGKKEQWSLTQTTRVTFLSGLAHALSTVLLGVAVSMVGGELNEKVQYFSAWVAPGILIALGIFYIYQHHRHRHFHLHAKVSPFTKGKIVFSLVIAMFFSPCLEIEAYFLISGTYGWVAVLLLATLYTVVTVTGMVVWVRIAYQGLVKMNWHHLEHHAGIITGITLLITGIITILIH